MPRENPQTTRSLVWFQTINTGKSSDGFVLTVPIKLFADFCISVIFNLARNLRIIFDSRPQRNRENLPEIIQNKLFL
jgi:hypothetical protein